MSSDESACTLRQIVTDCCVDLFAAYDVDLHPATRTETMAPQELALSGIIGFTGDELQGTLVLCATRALMESPAITRSPSQDWIGELANQLLGRIKNRLLRFGITIQLSTPVTIRGQYLDLEPCHHNVEPLRIGAGQAAAMVWFDVEPSCDIALVPKAGADAEAQGEGELLLF